MPPGATRDFRHEQADFDPVLGDGRAHAEPSRDPRVRTFRLDDLGPGRCSFTMEEVFSGMLLPMIKGSLPDFLPVFDTYARDLKRAAEAGPR